MLALRYTKLEDIERVMEIIKQAQQYFKEKGINQWQNGYPNAKVIENDIKNGHSFVLIKNNEIVGTIAISFEGEATYNKIFEGDWKSNDNYAVIHRIAVDHELKGIGLSSEMIKQTELMCNKKSVGSIKVDTHEDNQAMQRSLIKNGFDPFFRNRRGNISRISCRVAVCCNRFSFVIENRSRITAITHSRKRSPRSITHAERSEFFDGQLRQTLLRFFFSLYTLPSCKNILSRYRNYRRLGHASIRFFLIYVFRLTLCAVFLCQEQKFSSVASRDSQTVRTLFCNDCIPQAYHSHRKGVS